MVGRALALLAVFAGVADARVRRYVEPGPPRPRSAIPKSGEWVGYAPTSGEFRVSTFPDRIAGDHAYDLFCPHSGEPNPAVIVVADRGETRGDVEGLALVYAATGFVTIVVEANQLSAMIDDLDAGRVSEEADAGCTIAGSLGVIGIGGAGDLALELARTRETGEHALAAAVAMFPSASARVPERTPAFVIEPEPVTPTAKLLVIHDSRPCDLRAVDDACWHWIKREWGPDRMNEELGRGMARGREMLIRSAQWLRARVAGDELANQLVDSWPRVSTITVSGPPPRYEPPAETRWLFSLPIEVGGSTHRDGGIAAGVRPELMLARIHSQTPELGWGTGFGVYGELVEESSDGVIGAGLTYVDYGAGLTFSPSLGVYNRSAGGPDTHGVSASLFVGRRGGIDVGPMDMPFGLRFDARFATDGSRDQSLMVSAQIDLVTVAAVVVLVAALLAHTN